MANLTKPYHKSALFLASARKTAGLKKQGDLAERIGASQQAVSRWEAGLSRPSSKQIPALAQALNLDESLLRDVVGYGAPAEMVPATATVSFDRDFPVDALAPESFENFVEQLAHLLYRDADVRRVGASGHNQSGIDVLGILPGGRRFTIQCKRVTRFGPAEVDAAVAKQTEPADEKVLALSRVASPQAAAALRKHAGWKLWDKHDLSRFVRALARHEQIRLVDSFFPGQRMALLGVRAAGPWQTPEDFFAPFENKFAAFRHDWPLVGQHRDVIRVLEKLGEAGNRVVLLEGRGGVGKSRLLKEISTKLTTGNRRLNVLFLSATEPLSRDALEELDKSPTLLVVDDAHDRSDLPLLFNYVASSAQDIRVLIATRPYASARLRSEAGVFALSNAIDSISVEPLSRDETRTLAAKVLETYGGAANLAEPIADATGDCALVTVIAARIAATEGLSPEMAWDTRNFRDTILGKFAKIITGELAGPGNQKAIADTMQVIALVQPFGIDDTAFRGLVASVTGLQEHVVSQTLRLLAEGGVIFRRGTQYRLMPDLLGDYIIEQSCIDANDRLNSLADRVFESAPEPLLGHVLVNLGRLDWRRYGGDSSKSQLVDHLWRALKVTSPYHDPALEAATQAAFYSPRQALDFVGRELAAGNRRDEFCRILKNVAYHLDHVKAVCELLWEIGRQDKRELNQHPSHAIRTLKELCAVEPNKPVGYNSRVVEFGVSLLTRAESFEHVFTPFDFLRGILATEGHTTEGDARTITLKGFQVNYDAVADLRAKVVDAAFLMLVRPPVRVACLAAKFLGSALHYPIGILNSRVPAILEQKYTAEFAKTLERLRVIVTSGTLEPLVIIAIADAISWHCNYSDRGTGTVAKAIMESLPSSLEFRTLGALADGWGQIFIGRFEPSTWQARLNQWLDDISTDLARAFPAPNDLWGFLDDCLERLFDARLTSGNSTHMLIHSVLRTNAALVLEVVENALESPSRRISAFAGTALFHLIREKPETGRRWARRFLDAGDVQLEGAVAQAYRNPPLDNDALDAQDYDLIVRVLGSAHTEVVFDAVSALNLLAERNPRLAFDLLRHVNFNGDARLIDHVFMFFHNEHGRAFATLTPNDVEFILSQLKPIPELKGHWIETLLSHLSARFPESTFRFFKERVELAGSHEKFAGMRPINYGPWVNVRLRFRESDCFPMLLETVWKWATERDVDDWVNRHNTAALFEAIFFPVDEQLLVFFSSKLSIATANDLRWMATILANAEFDFVFTHVDFVKGFLEACDRYGQSVRHQGVDALFRASMAGVRSGRVGEPFQRDLEASDRAKEILGRLPRLSAAYELYDAILKHAELEIREAHRQAESLDDG